MKHKFVVLLSGVLVCSMLLAGCGTNKAAEAAKKSEEIEKEGKSSEGEEEKTKEEEVKVEEPEEEPEKIGILLPEDEGRWEADTALFTEKLEAAGYQAEVRSADGNLQTQREQIGELLEAEAVALVVDPVDAYGLSDAFTEAEEKKIPIFSYDDLVMNSDLVKYFTTFDTRADGNLVAENIIKRMDLKKAQEEKRSFTIEFLMGTPENMGELFFYNGVLEKLQEYLDDGTLVCRSGRLTFDDTSVMRGSAASAKAVMNRVISEFYEVEGTPDIICTAADAYTYALEETLRERNIIPESGNWPFVTGRGSEAQAVKNVAEGKLAFTLYQDRSELVDTCVTMVTGYLSDDKAKVDSYAQYDNGRKIIGTYTCDAEVIDEDNYQILLDNGTYTEKEIMPEYPMPTPKEISPTPTSEESKGFLV